MERDQVLGEGGQPLDEELADLGVADESLGGEVGSVGVPGSIGDPVTQELAVQGGGWGRSPAQLERGGARVVGGCDGWFAAGS